MTGTPTGDGGNHNQQVSDLQWVIVTDPRRSTDRNTMRHVRAHVMNNYLLREQQNPNSTDIRVRNPSSRRNRPRAGSARSSFEERPEQRASEAQSNTQTFGDSLADLVPPKPAQPGSLHLGFGISNTGYDVFNTTPQFDNRGIDLAMLKHNCNAYFGSRAMCRKWSPLLLSARPAFLSTVCIASTFLDLMQMDFSGPRQSRLESVRTLAVRDETVRLISQSLSDPQTCADDATIVAVLHLFIGEMIVADDQVLQWHEQGLWTMVMCRGGLDRLGGEGVLAAMLTVEVFEMSIFRETRPRNEYVDYARQMSTPPQLEGQAALPESPLYCPFNFYYTLTRSRHCTLATLEVVNLTRDLTKVVLELQNLKTSIGPVLVGGDKDTLETQKTDLLCKISNLSPDTGSPNAATHEATRLCALLYATAIDRNKSFSDTARELRSTTIDDSGDITDQIRCQLMRTDLSNCWDSMVGVLFWITLVTGAACNTRQPTEEETTTTGAEDDDETSRGETQGTSKWLKALCVRCSILLSFQHTEAVLRSLFALLSVQGVLRDGEGDDAMGLL